jgi:ribonuclease Z
VTVEQVSGVRRGQRFAIVMDTRLCEAVYELAEEYGHLTVAQAARVAAECGVRRLILTHFSRRYSDCEPACFHREAVAVFSGEILLAEDLSRVAFPLRRTPTE